MAKSIVSSRPVNWRPMAHDDRPGVIRPETDQAVADPQHAPDEKEDPMGPPVNLRKLEEELDRNRLDEIASLLLSLTYGEMIELADAIYKSQPEGSAITQDNLSALLHRWSKSWQASTTDR